MNRLLRGARGEWVSRELTRLRLLAIVAPFAFLVMATVLLRGPFHGELHEFPGILSVLAVLAAGVSIFSFGIFALIARLEGRIIEQNRQLAILNEIAATSSESLELDGLLNVALDKVLGAMRAEAGCVCLADEETGSQAVACLRDPSGELVADLAAPACLEAIEDGAASPLEGAVAGRGGSVLEVPLRAEGRTFGRLTLVRWRGRAFSRSEADLARSIGAELSLAVRNAILFDKTRLRNQELAALLAVGQAASSSLHLADMLDEALDAILTVTSAEAAEVWLWDGGELRLERLRGDQSEAFAERTRFRLGEGLPGVTAEAGRPVAVHDLVSDPRLLRRGVTELGFQTYFGLPLLRAGELVGVLGVAARDPDALRNPAEHRLLEGIGEQVAVAIENARLHARVLDGAVLEERERIARELHDGLAQVLGYVNTQTLAIKKLLATGRREEAERHVAEMEATAREVYTDVREAILGLRSARGALLPNLRQYVSEYGRMAGAELELEVDEAVERLRLQPSVEIQLVRIVQEALSNVRKHAEATRAAVRLGASERELTIEVEDDGRGFDRATPVRTGWPRFGLQIMRERAQAIGGTFDVASEPGRGTKVVVRVPLEVQAEFEHAGAAR